MARQLNTGLLFERFKQLGVEDPNASRYKYVFVNEDYDFYQDDEPDMLSEQDFVESTDNIVHIGESDEPAAVIEASTRDRNPHHYNVEVDEDFVIPFEINEGLEEDETFIIDDEQLD